MPFTNADNILNKSGITGRVELVILAARLARLKKCSGVKALLMLETGEINIQDLHENLLTSLQEVQPQAETEENDTTLQSEQAL